LRKTPIFAENCRKSQKNVIITSNPGLILEHFGHFTQRFLDTLENEPALPREGQSSGVRPFRFEAASERQDLGPI
jgi:hypothetical protein